MLYSEIFRSLQGEGVYTGYPSIWLRTYLCNFECAGFSQPDPADPSTYHEVGADLDVINIKDITELPVFKYGCDSAYSWAKKFRHLQHEESPEEIVERLGSLLPEPGVWHNDDYEFHMVFTGGEPLLKRTQRDLVKLLQVWDQMPEGKRPRRITFESNATQKITTEMAAALNADWIEEVLLSYSPKLLHVSGESNKRAIKPDVIRYNSEVLHNSRFSLKFVINSDPRAWEELEWAIDEIGQGKNPVWLMPVGGRVEDQEATAGDVADMAVAHGYKVAARVHTYLWGNSVGK